MRKCALTTAVVLAIWLSSGATAQAQVASNVTMNAPVVTLVGGSTYRIDLSGTQTLGTNDTYGGLQVKVTDPTGRDIVPFVTQSQPGQGQTTAWAGYTFTGTQGNWIAEVKLVYTPQGGTQTFKKVTKNFTVP